MLDRLVKDPRFLSEEEIEEEADRLVKAMSGLTYDNAWKVLKSCEQAYKEAVYHLGHNAAIEMGGKPVQFVLNDDQ